jgi:hypothetical protein
LPFTNLYDDVGGATSATVFGLAPGMQGLYDAWLLTVLNMAIVGRGDIEHRAEHFAVGGDVAFAALLPVTYQGDTGDTLILMQAGVWASAQPVRGLALGGRFQVVGAFGTGPGDPSEGYLSLIPFVRVELGSFFIETRLLMNLDEPYGFAFEDGSFLHIWALQLVVGASF